LGSWIAARRSVARNDGMDKTNALREMDIHSRKFVFICGYINGS
jgi:hypothetical protein